MISYIRLSYFYQSAFMRMLRLLTFFFLTIILVSNSGNGIDTKFPVFFLSLFLMLELFFRYRVSDVRPSVSVADNNGTDLYISSTKEVATAFLMHKQTSHIIRFLFRLPQIQFILAKCAVSPKELPLLEIPTQEVFVQAFSIAKQQKNTFITSMDVIAAYLLLIEPQTKLLFTRQLKQEEFLHLIAWAKTVYSEEEFPQKKRVTVSGGGIGEPLTTGWTPETKKYTQDFSYRAWKLMPHKTGREKDFALLLEALAKKENNNVLLVGDTGSGRENLVALLSQESFTNAVPDTLRHKKILELMIGPLIAGASTRADLETRLQAIIDEVSHARNVILYIPEIQNITGSTAYNTDLSGALFPYLKEGKTPIIATVSIGNYKAYLEKSPLHDVMNTIQLQEPDIPTAVTMLTLKADSLEKKYPVVITYKAIQAAVQYAHRYFQDRVLPGSAADLLEAAVNRLSQNGQRTRQYVLPEHIVGLIEEKTHVSVAEPNAEEKNLLLHLEEKMHERVIGQKKAIGAISESMRRLRSGLVSAERPVSFLFLGPTGVGKTETAKALATLYFGGEEKILRLDMSEYAGDDGVKRLLGAPPGEGEERGELTDKIADNPFALVLLDEFEKAHPKILDLFLQVLEDGRLTDNKGKTVSFINSIIIATSNAGAEFVREEINKGSVVDKVFSQKLLDQLQTQHLFRPELLNRFDEVIVFTPLQEPEMKQISVLMLADLAKRLAEQDITFTYDEKLLTKVVKEGFDQQFGARPLRRYIQDNVEDILAQKKLRDEIRRGNIIKMSTDETGVITTVIS